MKLEVDLSNADDIANAYGLLSMLQGHTGSVSKPAASAPAPSAPPPGNAPAAPPPSAPPASAPASAPPSAPPPAPAAPSAPPPPPAAPSGQPTQADLSAHIQAYSKAGSAKATKAKLAEMGFASVGAIPPEHYAYVMQHMPLA